MTPAERLLAAADLLEKRAGEATDGPWRDLLMGSEGSKVLAGGNTVSTARHIALARGSEDANYIATMHPEVGKAVASTLRDGVALLTTDPVWCGTHLLPLADLLLAGAS